MKKSSGLYNLCTELLLLYTAPVIFLVIYVAGYSKPLVSAGSHLYSLTLMFSLLVLFRLLTNQLVSHKKIASLITSSLYAGITLSLSIYYLSVIIGLESWRRVITEELISVYANQAPELCLALGVSYSLILASIGCTYALLWFLFYCYLKNHFWQLSYNKVSKNISISLIISALIFCAYYFHATLFYASLTTEEPFVLTLKGGKTAHRNHNSWQGVVVNEAINKNESVVTAHYQPNKNALHKNLVIIVVDALRPDHMGVYGYHRNTSPFLSQLYAAGKLERVSSVRASCSESSCGLISLASARFVHQLPSKPLTLQQVLKKHGYAIHMILGGDHTNFYGLKEAYGEVDEYFDATMSKGYYINDDTLVINKTRSLPDWNNKPTMIQFHLMSSHVLGKRLNEYKVFQPVINYDSTTYGKPKPEHINFYDNGVVQADATIQQLLKSLESKHYLDDALVVITADHGEELGEHGSYSHAKNLREKSINIPLLFIPYGNHTLALAPNKTFASQVDIAPTILSHFEMPIPSSWSGIPLQSRQKPDFTYFMLAPEIGLYDHRYPKHLFKYLFNMQTSVQSAYDISSSADENDIFWKIPLSLKQEWHSKLSSVKLENH